MSAKALELIPLTNRASDAGDWYHLVPLGSYPHPDSGFLQVIDEKAAQSIVNSFTPKALIDQEHWSYDPKKSSEAMGWATELQNRADGVWAKVEWSDMGQKAIENKRYRFISPAWLPKDVEKIDSKTIRPLRLDTAGLTNKPNLRGMVPLSNREGIDPTDITPTKPSMKNIATKLGLSAEASEDAILAELTKITNTATALEARAVKAEAEIPAIKNRVTELEKERDAMITAEADAFVEKYAIRIKPENKDKVKAQFIANREGTKDLFESLSDTPVKLPITNRAGASTPSGDDAAEKMKAEVKRLVTEGKMSRGAAITEITNRQPELYKEWRNAGCPAF